MRIFICTHGRFGRQITYDNLPQAIQNKVEFVIQERELKFWDKSDYSLVLLPDHVRTLPDTREWLQHNVEGKIVMMDDDLVFAVRRVDDPTKFRAPEGDDLVGLFDEIEEQLEPYVHVGVSHREGANRRTEPYLEVGRMMRVLAYQTDVVVRERVISNRTPDVEDFDVTLQLLRKGYPNRIINTFVHNQSGSNQTGGCSEYRTPQTHERDIKIFANHHKDFVKVVKKKTKDKWCADKNGERTDVIIQWKKAYESSKNNSQNNLF